MAQFSAVGEILFCLWIQCVRQIDPIQCERYAMQRAGANWLDLGV